MYAERTRAHVPIADLQGVREAVDVRPRVLSDYPADASSRRAALTIGAISLCVFLVLVPYAKVQLPAAPWFIPLVQPVLIFCDCLTAFLLFGQHRVTRSRATLVLASSYVFSALMAGVHLLTFPGVFTSTGLLGAGAQSTAYLFIFWHAGFPIGMLAYAALEDRPAQSSRSGYGAVPLALLLVAVLTGALGAVAILGSNVLPALLAGRSYSSGFNAVRYGQCVVTAFALAVMWRRRSRSTLDLWLTVVLSVNLFEIGLVAIFNSGRYDLGFYAGRVYSLLASSFVLLTLLREQSKLYQSLVAAKAIERSELMFREGREALRLAMLAGRMGTWSHGLSERSVWWSPELEEILGLTEGGLPRRLRALVDRIHPDDQERVKAAAAAALHGPGELAVEFRVRHEDGEWRWVAGRGEAALDSQGAAQAMTGILMDISARKKSDEALARRDAEFATLADHISQFAWMADATGWINWYNQRWFAYTGTNLEQMQGWGWRSVHHPDHVDRVVANIARCFETGEPWEDVFPLRRADGEYGWFLSRALPIRDGGGKIIRWFGTNTDITELRASEQSLREADRRKDEFLATLAHELRNPLAAIRNAAAILIKKGSDEKLRVWATAIIERQVRGMARLLDDLLDLSRITHSKLALQRQRVALASVVENAVEVARPIVDIRRQTLTVMLPPGDVWLEADPLRLSQVISNLLTNAAKYTEPGGHINLTAHSSVDRLEIRVRDSGKGIAADWLDRVFVMFAQVQNSSNSSESGLGIGLALVRGLVELHGGTVHAESAGLGRGSEFVVALPLPSPVVAEIEAPARDELLPAGPRRRILVADDNRDGAESLANLVATWDHDVAAVVHDGRKAFAAAEELRPDIALLDIGMPEWNGYEVARRIRQSAWGGELKLIALTGWGSEDAQQRAKEAGFDGHLTKPVDPDELASLLASFAVAPLVLR